MIESSGVAEETAQSRITGAGKGRVVVMAPLNNAMSPFTTTTLQTASLSAGLAGERVLKILNGQDIFHKPKPR